MFTRFLIVSLLLAGLVRAEVVSPPVERVITDEFERTMNVRIVGVTADALEIVRAADQARFSFPLKKLSDADQAFAAELLKKTVASRPLPDTPMVAAIRRDFQVFDPAKRRLVAVDPSSYATTRIFVVAVQHLYDPAYAFGLGGSRVNTKNAVPDQAPILWISIAQESALFELVAEKLPEGHAMLSYRVQETALEQGRRVQTDFINAWFKRNRSDPFSGEGMAFRPSEKERADLLGKLRRAMPPYWTDYAAHFDVGDNGGRSYPRFIALRRDGSPVRFRGTELAGSRKVVMTVLRDNAAELE